MRTIILAIYEGSGLANIESPWIASLLLFAILALVLLLSAKGVVFAHTIRPNRSVLSRIFGLGSFAIAAGFTIVAAGVGTFIQADRGVKNSDEFTVYYIALILIANVPFFLTLWRAGLLKNQQT
jgi:hypothetical protein